jgi:hypothetical protein
MCKTFFKRDLTVYNEIIKICINSGLKLPQKIIQTQKFNKIVSLSLSTRFFPKKLSSLKLKTDHKHNRNTSLQAPLLSSHVSGFHSTFPTSLHPALHELVVYFSATKKKDDN